MPYKILEGGIVEITMFEHDMLLSKIIPYSPCSVKNSTKLSGLVEGRYDSACNVHNPKCPVIERHDGTDYCTFEQQLRKVSDAIDSGVYKEVVVNRYRMQFPFKR